MPNRIREALQEAFAPTMRRLSARVESRPVDATGRGLGYVLCEVAGQSGVRVYTDGAYYPGDGLFVEQRGEAAAASYVALGWMAGARPDSGMIEFTGETSIGNDDYAPGDLLWGNPFGPHFWLDYSEGILWLRNASTPTGAINAAVGVYIAGNPAGVHAEYGPTGIEFRNGENLLSGWDAIGRTIYGVETFGSPHGPGIQQMEIADPETGEIRYVWQILGLNGVPGAAFVTGTASEPDDYKFYVGPAGAANRLRYEDGILDITGTLHAGDVTLDSAGITLDYKKTPGPSDKIKWVRSDGTTATYVGAWRVAGIPALFLTATGTADEAGALVQVSASGAATTGSTGSAQTTVSAQQAGVAQTAKIVLEAVESTGKSSAEITADRIVLTGAITSSGVVWVSAADAQSATYSGAGSRIHPAGYAEGSYDGTTHMYFALPLPYQANGLAVGITEIKFYGYTATNAAYFNAIYLRASDLDGTTTDLLAYTTDIGNGSSGDTGAVTLHSGTTLSLPDAPVFFVVDLGGTGSYGDWRVYGMRIAWEAV